MTKPALSDRMSAVDVRVARQLPVCLTVAAKALGVKLCIARLGPDLFRAASVPKTDPNYCSNGVKHDVSNFVSSQNDMICAD